MSITRRSFTRGALALATSGPIFACSEARTGEPVKITYDRDTCDHCAMLISERGFAAQAFDPVTRKMAKFDDVGCLAVYATEKGFVDHPDAKLWVMNNADQATWLDARAASYVDGAFSPMGYGFAAKPKGEGPLDFASVKASARKRAHCATPTEG
jgi:nitrous oxide reductase accessory protein NosL